MKIERINENQIRCTLSSVDLSARDLNLVELAYGSEKAKKLFREMIQKASSEVGFDAEDIPLMVEAIPLSAESIMLIITKIEDPEELDTRFSKFSMASEEENPLSALAGDLLEGADGLLELLSQASAESAEAPSGDEAARTGGRGSAADDVRTFTFESLEEVCRAARVAGQVCRVPNALYKNQAKSRYYLVIRRQAETESGDGDSFNRICNLLSEYGTAIKSVPSSEAYYQEHYETIVKANALQTLSEL